MTREEQIAAAQDFLSNVRTDAEREDAVWLLRQYAPRAIADGLAAALADCLRSQESLSGDDQARYEARLAAYRKDAG